MTSHSVIILRGISLITVRTVLLGKTIRWPLFLHEIPNPPKAYRSVPIQYLLLERLQDSRSLKLLFRRQCVKLFDFWKPPPLNGVEQIVGPNFVRAPLLDNKTNMVLAFSMVVFSKRISKLSLEVLRQLFVPRVELNFKVLPSKIFSAIGFFIFVEPYLFRSHPQIVCLPAPFEFKV